MPFGLGFFAVAGAGGAAGSFDLLETQVLGSAAASVTFSSLSGYASTYKHLQLRISSTPVGNGVTMWVQFNGDTASNYNHHFLYGNGGSSANSGNGATNLGTLIGGVAGYANTMPMAAVMDILDFADPTKNKVTRTLSGSSEIDLASGLWRSTAAITSLTAYWGGTNITAGSRFSLYGIRGA